MQVAAEEPFLAKILSLGKDLVDLTRTETAFDRSVYGAACLGPFLPASVRGRAARHGTHAFDLGQCGVVRLKEGAVEERRDQAGEGPLTRQAPEDGLVERLVERCRVSKVYLHAVDVSRLETEITLRIVVPKSTVRPRFCSNPFSPLLAPTRTQVSSAAESLRLSLPLPFLQLHHSPVKPPSLLFRRSPSYCRPACLRLRLRLRLMHSSGPLLLR